MKTRNNKTENRNNRYSQVLLRVAAVVVSVVLLSFTVSAQDLWKELLTYNSFGKMALLMVDENNAATETSSVANAIVLNVEEETDQPLEVQDWMSNDSFFGNYENFGEVASEKTLEIESWMTDESYFSNQFVTEKEEAMPLEAWMCDADFFNN